MASPSNTSKTDKDAGEPAVEQKAEQQEQKSLTLGEDDEFEDFPVDDWGAEETEAASEGAAKHLWDESWDDDDTSDDFSTQLKYGC
ncbi:dss1/sem1 [Niveomyces insectorum RCEF 264]|uniref:26S proteasome complex subunit SEM1 n=1 Tax=Niveomyces insectorum RCEF 264 TaxID=1081102 RepID=A0A167UQJ5_9HYPO|nr:dss1/sem1 [Niveomyces insectorum RCEF 264]